MVSVNQIDGGKRFMKEQKYYTVAEVAEMFGKSRQTIHNWISSGRFPNRIEAGGDDKYRVVVIPEGDIERVKRADELRRRADAIEQGLQFVAA